MDEREDLLVVGKTSRLGRRPLHKLGLMAIALGMICVQPAALKSEPKRPRILGIQQVEIGVSDESAGNRFYRSLSPVMGACDWCEQQARNYVLLPNSQEIILSSTRSTQPQNLMKSIGFEIDDVRGMMKFLGGKKIHFDQMIPVHGDPYLTVVDPEGHEICFIDRMFEPRPVFIPERKSFSVRIIHVGLVVKDRAAMDHFYKDILGFRLYWSGGMKDGETNWVAMQVPDGTDWIEYMLNVNPNADQRELGVMNHISLGVVSVKAAAEQLEKAGVKLPEQPKIGRDGKWQLNLYDPDWTRVELMEFTPVEKPCCAEFTGPHPKL